MTTRIITTAVTAAVMLALNANALTITRNNADFQGTNPINPTAAEIAAITGSSTLSLLYKTGGEEGPFRNNYETTFGSGNETAQIIYDGNGEPSIAPTSGALWLIAKDGASNNPVWYLWDLSSSGLNWNGTDILDIGVLWPQQGSISYVGIYGGGQPGRVPEGGSTAIMLGLGLMGFAGLRRKLKK